jgi:hypothetical protein
LETAFKELIEHKVLLAFQKEEERGERNKIIDIKYILTPNASFVRDVKAANRRQQDAKSILSLDHKSMQSMVGVIGIGRRSQ